MSSGISEIKDFSIKGLRLNTYVVISANEPTGINSILNAGRIVHRGLSRFYVQLDNGERYYYRTQSFHGKKARMFLATQEIRGFVKATYALARKVLERLGE